MGLTGLAGHSLSPISPISPEILDCCFVSPVPPEPPGFCPCHPGKFLKFYSKSQVGGLGGVVCREALIYLM